MLDVMGFSKYIYQSKTCISMGDVMSGGFNVGHKSEDRIQNRRLMCLATVVVHCHAGYM